MTSTADDEQGWPKCDHTKVDVGEISTTDGVLAVVAGCAFVVPVALSTLVRREHDQREVMDRRDAEHAVRRDTHVRE